MILYKNQHDESTSECYRTFLGTLEAQQGAPKPKGQHYKDCKHRAGAEPHKRYDRDPSHSESL